jgi:hypothetical protein
MAFTRYMAFKYRLNPALLLEGPSAGPQTVRLVGSLAGRAYDPFDAEEYAHLLAFVWGVDLDDVLIGDRWTSYLTDDTGRPLELPFGACVTRRPPVAPPLDDY